MIERLNATKFERLCAAQGANTEQERAELVGADRGTVRRWINGEVSPLLSTAMRVARVLKTNVHDLWGAE